MSTNGNHSFLKQVTAGAVAAFLGRFCSQPLEVIKLQVQLQNKNDVEKRSIAIIISQIWKYDGIKGFFRGHNAAQVLGMMQGSAQFWGFSKFKSLLDETPAKNYAKTRDFLAGSIAGSLSTVVLNPLDTLKTRVISQRLSKPTKDSIIQMYYKTLYYEGPAALLRGTSAGVVQVAPLIGLKFMFYNLFCNIMIDFEDLEGKSHLPKYALFISGALSGISSNALTYPMDVVRRKMQLTNIAKAKNTDLQIACKKMILCGISIQKEYGVQGFFIGIIPSLLKSAVSTSVTFLIYDTLIEWLS